MNDIPKILIVDDNIRMINSISALLKSRDYEIHAAKNRMEAAKNLNKTTYDLILLDLIMPDMDGFEVMDHLSAHNKDTLVIIITGHSSVELAVKALRMGAYDFITKPFDPEELLTTTKNALKQRSTEKKIQATQEKLLLSEKKYQTLIETTSDWIWAVDLDGIHTYASPKVKNILGYDADEIIGTNFFEFLVEDDKERSKTFFYKSCDSAKPFTDWRVKQKHKNGRSMTFEVNGTPVFDQKGKLAFWQGFNKDITGKVQAEINLMESEEKYRQLAELLPQPIFEIDEKGELTFVNIISFDLFGYSEDDIKKGLNALELVAPEDRDMVRDNIQRVLNRKKPTGTEFTIIRKDGSTFPALIYSNPIMKKDQILGLRGIITDLTDIKNTQDTLLKSEKKLFRSKKMESLGLMAGAIAHDLNNILSGIVSYPELLLMDLPEDSPLRKPIETIHESGERAAKVVADLVTVARGVAATGEVKNLNVLIEDYFNSVEHIKLKKKYPAITFKTQLAPDLLNINCTPTHIEKCLINLISNASDAINANGNVIISTKNTYLDEPLDGYEEVLMGKYALLTVSDDGTGISTIDLERIFEPFYTKKVMGKSGTGLGLTIVWNTIQDHNGFINVKSEEKGTSFELYFPGTRKKVAPEEKDVPLEKYLGNGENILIVDDEKRQREITGEMLTRLQYSPKAVSNGKEAIKYLKSNPVDLVVLDMIMPKGLSGRETYERILEIHSSQKAIITSGFALTEDIKIAQELGAGKYIKKPYTLEKIGLAIKEELKK